MPTPSPRPNVLFLVADDHQHDAIGAFGHPIVQTPIMDRLVREGTAFMRTYMMGSLIPAVCSPARASLLTGQTTYRAVEDARISTEAGYVAAIGARHVTLPELFRQNGYETFATGKWHNDLAALRRSFEHGSSIFWGGMCDHDKVPVFDLPRQSESGVSRDGNESIDTLAGQARVAAGLSSEVFCGAAEAFLRHRSRERPFFAYVALTSPHDPRTPPERYRRLYDEGSIPLPGNFLPEHPFDNGELEVRDEQLERKPLNPAAMRRHLAEYYGMISHHDAQIGRLTDLLRTTGQMENTIIVYVSDHGLALGSHGLLGKQNLYEHSIRVPLIIRGPDLPSNYRVTAPIYSLDLYRTVAELSGLKPPPDLDSMSLLPFLRGKHDAGRETIGALYKDLQRMVTDGRWKLIEYRVNEIQRSQLFDLLHDPDEMTDLGAQGNEAIVFQINRLRSRLVRWQHEIGDRWMLPRPDRAPSAAATF